MSSRTSDGPVLMRLLPDVIASGAVDGSPLLALIEAAESLCAPDVELLDAIDGLLDPWATPEALLPMLAAWVGYDWLASWPKSTLPSDRLRSIVSAAPACNRTRGTSNELVAFLETITGVDGFTIVDDGSVPFHITVVIPPSAPNTAQFHALVERTVAIEAPDHVTVDVVRAPSA